jgi:hypothetical protein
LPLEAGVGPAQTGLIPANKGLSMSLLQALGSNLPVVCTFFGVLMLSVVTAVIAILGDS